MLKCSVNQHPCEVRDYNYATFIGREIEAQRGQMICPWLHDLSREAQPLIFACYCILTFSAKEKKNHLWDISYSEELQEKHFSCLLIFSYHEGHGSLSYGNTVIPASSRIHYSAEAWLLLFVLTFSHLLFRLKFPVKINMYISWWRAVMFHRMTENTFVHYLEKGRRSHLSHTSCRF